MAFIKASLVAPLIVMAALSLRAEEVLYLCEINRDSTDMLELSFERDDAWAAAWNRAVDLNDQELPSFSTEVELSLRTATLWGSIDVIFEPGFSKDYAFFIIAAELLEGTLNLSLMEDPDLGTVWGDGRYGDQILELNCAKQRID